TDIYQKGQNQIKTDKTGHGNEESSKNQSQRNRLLESTSDGEAQQTSSLNDEGVILPSDDANRHIDKFFKITQHIKQNEVSDDALRLSFFPYSLTRHAIAWYDRLPWNSIHSFDDTMRKFLSKYFPPSMVTKLRNAITKFEQKPHESLFEALGGTFIQKTSKECYDLIENTTGHHNHWDTFAIRDESSRNISSTSTTKSPEVVRYGVTLAGTSVSPLPLFKEADREPETIMDQKKLSFLELTYTQMILELADRSITRPTDIAEDVFVKVGKFYFHTDFVVVDYVVEPCVPLILGRPFLRTGRALIDVYGEELTLRVDDEAITFKVGQTSKYSYNYAESINQVDVINVACEEGDFILEEIEACLTSESIPLGINDTDLDLEGDIHLLEELLNNDPSLSPLPPKELNVEEIKTVKSSIDEPLELELKELPSHLEYTYLEGADKLLVIIAKDLKDDEKNPS
nr:reverse transcriptase domain-containing protein [Tanacetum cinerariifolium]